MNYLRLPLQINGLFSFASGLLLALRPDTVNGWLGIDVPTVLRLFGLALIGHALFVFWGASRPNPRPFIMLNLAAIAPYPVLMGALLAGGIVETSLGRLLVAADGIIIGVIAAMHWRTLQTQSHSPAPASA